MRGKMSALSLLLPASALAGTAQKPPTFGAGVEMVTVDAVVMDKDGRAVAGLAKEDFALEEDGVRQEIASFEAVELEPQPDASSAATPSLEPSRASAPGRTFVIVFDALHLEASRASRAKTALVEFLRTQARPGDQFMLAVPGTGKVSRARWPEGEARLRSVIEGLKGHAPEPRTGYWIAPEEAAAIVASSSREVFEAVLGRFMSLSPGGKYADEAEARALVSSRVTEVYAATKQGLRETLTCMRTALDLLAEQKRRKAVILVSEGLAHDGSVSEFKDVLEASRRANAAIYFLEAGILGAEHFAEQEGVHPDATAQAFAGSNALAFDSGGFTIRSTNDLAEGLRRIGEQSARYYLLGYQPTNTKRDGKFRKIKVTVKGEGKTVQARKGYTAPKG